MPTSSSKEATSRKDKKNNETDQRNDLERKVKDNQQQHGGEREIESCVKDTSTRGKSCKIRFMRRSHFAGETGEEFL